MPLRCGTFETEQDVSMFVNDFHQMHQDIFAVSDPEAGIETVSWGAEVRCRIGSGKPGRLASDSRPVKLPMRPVRFLGTDWIEADVYRLESIREGMLLTGPLVIESDFTSIVVDPGARAWRDAIGNLVIDVNC